MSQSVNCPVVNAVIAEGNNVPLRSEIARFAFVGVVNTAVDLAVLNTLIVVSHHGRAGLLYSLFKTLSFLVAALNSYWMNSKWTFRQSARQDTMMRVGRFLLVSIFGLAINVETASWVSAVVVPVRWLERWWPSVAALAGTSCGLAINFAGYKYLVFSRWAKRAEIALDPNALRGNSDAFTEV
jgi:putative flippase GtrA